MTENQLEEVQDSEDGNVGLEVEQICKRVWYDWLVNGLSRFAEAILTIGDFFGMIVAVALIFHFYVIIGTASNFGCFVMWFYGLMSGNIALIPVWTFFKFSYFRDRFIPWKCVWKLFIAPKSWINGDRPHNWDLSRDPEEPHDSEADDQKCCTCCCGWGQYCWPVIECLIGCLFIVFCVLALAGKYTWPFDVFMFVIIIVLPLTKLSLVCLGYLWNFWTSLVNCTLHDEKVRDTFFRRHDKIRDPFVYSLYGTLRLWRRTTEGKLACSFCATDADAVDDADFEQKSGRITIIELLFELVHLLASLVLIIWLIVIISKEKVKGKDAGYVSGFIIILVVVFFPLSQIQFPFFFLNMLLQCDFHGILRSEKTMTKNKDFTADMVIGKNTKKFRVISITMWLLILILLSIVTGISAANRSAKREYSALSIDSNYEYTGQPPPPSQGQQKEIVSQLCYVKPYHLTMLQLIALASSSYLNDTWKDPLVTEFFNDTGITVSRSETMDLDEYKYAAASYFTFNEQDLTVVSFRGTSNAMDAALDLQMFMSSFLLTASSIFSSFTTTATPYTNRQIKKVIAFPLIILKKVTVMDKYMQELKEWYDNKVEKKSNILFVGHSLGGGLAKLFGHMYGTPSVSVSGPGVSVLQQVYPPAITKSSDNIYESSLVAQAEIIPDLDLIPRVEVTAGTRYRVLCSRGAKCHSIDRTLCMVGVMCQTEHENFCRSIWRGKEYDAMKELVK